VKDKVASVPLPGATAGKACRRSSWFGHRDQRQDQNKALAQEWVKFFTDSTSRRADRPRVPANATDLLDQAAAVKGNEATALAAKEQLGS